MNLSKEALQVVAMLDRLNYSDELGILKHLTEKYNLKTVSKYSDDNKIPRQTIYNKIESGKIPSIDLMNQTFIIEI